ncbi:MAG: glutamate mutase L [Candidatus Cloacimonetes bacterium]|nr:glutamate mutase L [Candidatus Cloacimonadota bacterium]
MKHEETIYTCQSCGRIMQQASDFGGGRVGNAYCSRCADEFGFLRGYSDVVSGIHAMLEQQLDIAPGEARRIAEENIYNVPAWMKREKHMQDTTTILITDIGSTTTKAVLLEKSDAGFAIVDLHHAPTTVEKPHEDVRIGVWQAVKGLEEKTGRTLLLANTTPQELAFAPGVLYLTTSSAGGGLQILVVGLTVTDSASSARRAAYGAGGVLLDTFAIDDKRSAVEQMLAMQALHPDIILFSGGIDGGAVTGLVRLAEILSLSNPRPKFGGSSIPLVYAGNRDAEALVRSVFADSFDLHVVPNLRPTMTDENLEPARQTIHRLFMDKVMQQAPGYGEVKKIATDDIIPTPMGVIKSLQLLSRSLDENIVAADIGGATTDIFSNILGQYYRTVSANLGMSYSVCNVLAETGYANIARWLPGSLDETAVRDYIGNKMLRPEQNPSWDWEFAIEHACAREALRLALAQHMGMHFNTEKIGFLDRLKLVDYDKFTETVYVEKKMEERKFRGDSINIMIAAGGVISAASPQQAALIIADGMQPRGVTEIWRDRRFISPHLGKLSDMDEQLALDLLLEHTYQRLAVVIRPVWRKARPGEEAFELKIDGPQGVETLTVKTDSLMWLPATNGVRRLSWITRKGYGLPENADMETELPVLIDTRLEPSSCRDAALEMSGFATVAPPDIHEPHPSRLMADMAGEDLSVRLELPYPGEILVKAGDRVQPNTLVGENRYDPPKIFILSLFNLDGLAMDAERLRQSLLVKIGDEIRAGQKIVDTRDHGLLDDLTGKRKNFHSPIRGRVEGINYEAGVIVAREIQDYSTKPVKVNVAAKLGVEPKSVRGLMKKKRGDFVYAGEVLASRLLDRNAAPSKMFCHAPSTGTITDIDTKSGKATIRYDREPFELHAGVCGVVESVEETRAATIRFEGLQMYGIIGFGPHGWGTLDVLEKAALPIDARLDGKVLACMQPVDAAFMRAAVKAGVNGVVAPSMPQKEAVAWLEAEIGVALTGNEPVACPLVLTEGFGLLPMSAERRERFTEHSGGMCYLRAATQIRAGVERPRIVLYNSE